CNSRQRLEKLNLLSGGTGQGQFGLALKVEAINGGSLSFQEVAARTGLDPTVIDNAIKAGLLTKIEWEGRWRIPSEAVQRFNAQYIVLAQIESNRVLRRLQFLREWSHEQEQQVFP